MKKREPYKIVPHCNSCDYKNKSIAKEPCLSCSDEYSNWDNKKKGKANAKKKNQS